MTILHHEVILSLRKDRTFLWKEASLLKKLYLCIPNMKNY